jgi:hypothetical protein
MITTYSPSVCGSHELLCPASFRQFLGYTTSRELQNLVVTVRESWILDVLMS